MCYNKKKSSVGGTQMKKKGNGTLLERLVERIAAWDNLGYTDEDVTRYMDDAARDNLRAVAFYSGIGVFALAAVLVLRCISDSAPNMLVALYAVGIVLSGGLWYGAGHAADREKHISRAANVCGLLFSVLWYTLTMYIDIVHSPDAHSVILCLAFFAMPVMVDVLPIQNVIASGAALICAYMLELRFMTMEMRMNDVAHLLVSAALGIVVAWGKTRSKIGSLRYLDMYQTMSSLCEITAQINLRSNTFIILQAPNKVRRVAQPGMSADDIIHKIGEILVSGEYSEGFYKFLDRSTMAKRLKSAPNCEWVYMDRHGVWHQLILLPRTVEDGVVSSVVVVSRNVSTQKQREKDYERELEKTTEEAIRANISKTDFLRRMSHDIRTPINGVRGMIEIANRFPNDLERQADCREKILEASNYLTELVNDVLDMNRLESGEAKFDLVPFDLVQLLDELHHMQEQMAEERGLRLTEERNITHTQLIGSPVHLRQILNNIVSNAFKYNRRGGSVDLSIRELSTKDGAAQFEFTCTDTGVGMSEEFRQHIYEPFAQEEAPGRTKIEGTGLGMAITKKLVDEMGGTIEFDTHKNIGTTFVVTLPLKIDENVQESAQPRTEVRDLSGMHILIAEDNELNMEIAEFMVAEKGADVTKAWNGREAVEQFAASPVGSIDLIMMDLMMPVQDGLSAARQIRRMNRSDAASVPIFAMTANAFAEDVAACREAGINEHFAKPLDIGKILAAVAKYK